MLCVSHPAVLKAFPQHGPGRKHLRSIILSDWQLDLTHAHPGALIRGLIHSDGCRVLNRFRTKLPSGRVAEYEYVRYSWPNPNHRNLTVSHRKSVAILEELVGPKT